MAMVKFVADSVAKSVFSLKLQRGLFLVKLQVLPVNIKVLL